MAYHFGAFTLDYNTRELRRRGVEVRLSPKAFELLAMLVRNRARAMSKAELQAALWPSTFVEETNLASLAAEIRRALGDRATNSAFLRTVHRFGYRFVADVVDDDVAKGQPQIAKPCVILENRTLPLLSGANVIGRSPDATIQCERTGVSRHHARIVVRSDGATLEDLGSKNGTYLQHKRITSATLSDGDEIRIGNATLVFRMELPLAATDTVASDPGDGSRDEP